MFGFALQKGADQDLTSKRHLVLISNSAIIMKYLKRKLIINIVNNNNVKLQILSLTFMFGNNYNTKMYLL